MAQSFSIVNKIRRRMDDLLQDRLIGKIPPFKDIRPKPGNRILIYHGVDALGSTTFNSRFISAATLESHLKWFKENAHIISLQDYFEGKFKQGALNLALTFDDGYRNNYTRALPLLEKYQLPATFFVTPILAANQDILWPDYLDIATFQGPAEVRILGEEYRKKGNQYYHIQTGKGLKSIAKNNGFQFKKTIMDAFPADFRKSANLADYWELMSIGELRKAAASPLIEIGAHGLLHNNLDQVPLSDAIQEMAQSKAWLEEILGQEISSLAYPDGAYSRALVDEAEKLGYSRQLAVDFWFDEDANDSRLRERFGINPYVSTRNQLRYIRKGHYR